MPLDREALRSSIVRAFQDMEASQRTDTSVPLLHDQICAAVASAYDTWFKGALGDLMPVITPGPGALAIALRPFLMATWGSAFAAYSAAATFVPAADEVSGVVINSLAQGAVLQTAISTSILAFSPSVESFAERIAALLATYTTGLIVQITLNHPPGTKTGSIH